MSPRFVSFISHAQTVRSHSLFPRLSIFVCFHRASYVFEKLNAAFRLHNLLKEYKVFVHNLWKSVCVRVECSIAEEYEDTLRWEANRSAGYCLLCLELLHPMGLNQALWKMNLFPVETIGKPAFRWNRNLCHSIFFGRSAGVEFTLKWSTQHVHMWECKTFFGLAQVSVQVLNFHLS